MFCLSACATAITIPLTIDPNRTIDPILDAAEVDPNTSPHQGSNVHRAARLQGTPKARPPLSRRYINYGDSSVRPSPSQA